ncbi:lysozyme inhibitor LprI family protein [Pseudomonas sp. dw_612]|uniref:lysozyme inhibitor LprI family protein n=1 Tax=Pseudomonas sp. dw_612 TaxID=2720080 RepID=UPI001BD61526|nr:lysozyme inhibitor LprI family protein [Pseudomonas sp. dw_612]
MKLDIGLKLAVVTCCLLLGTAQATSFDCAKASTPVEHAICESPQLSRLDEQINSLYVQALDRVADKTALRQEQRDWLKQRNTCTTTDCLVGVMSARVQEQMAANPPKVAPAPKPVTPAPAPVPQQKIAVDRSVPSVSTSPAPAVSSPPVAPVGVAPTNNTSTKDPHELLPLKLAGLAVLLLLIAAVWLHHRGSMTIYQDYTDALWTSLTPAIGIGSYFALAFFEVPKNYAVIAALVITGLMALQVIIQTYRSNGVSLYFLLALFAKVGLLLIYFLMMALILAGGSRNQREARRKRGWMIACTSIFVFFSGWICRHRHFSSINDYMAGRV